MPSATVPTLPSERWPLVLWTMKPAAAPGVHQPSSGRPVRNNGTQSGGKQLTVRRGRGCVCAARQRRPHGVVRGRQRGHGSGLGRALQPSLSRRTTTVHRPDPKVLSPRERRPAPDAAGGPGQPACRLDANRLPCRTPPSVGRAIPLRASRPSDVGCWCTRDHRRIRVAIPPHRSRQPPD